jgi:hypothetical protein
MRTRGECSRRTATLPKALSPPTSPHDPRDPHGVAPLRKYRPQRHTTDKDYCGFKWATTLPHTTMPGLFPEPSQRRCSRQRSFDFAVQRLSSFAFFALLKAFQDRRTPRYQRGFIGQPLCEIGVILTHDIQGRFFGELAMVFRKHTVCFCELLFGHGLTKGRIGFVPPPITNTPITATGIDLR